MSTAYIPWIPPQNYQSIKRTMRTHPDFPDTYDEWVYLTNKKIAEITASALQRAKALDRVLNADPESSSSSRAPENLSGTYSPKGLLDAESE
jgi:hypothetical protein